MIRLFVGLAIPSEIRRRLSFLGGGIPGAHWVPESNHHITLRFIGEVDEATANMLHDALAAIRAPAFTVTIAGLGSYGRGRRIHTLWAGVTPSPPLLHLHGKIESAMVRAGLEPEGRRYSPHVTLARLDDAPTGRVQAFIAGNNLLNLEFPAGEFTLFSSLLGRGDPVYRAETEYPLVGGEGFSDYEDESMTPTLSLPTRGRG